jgi:hypothetical protein
MDNHSEQNYQRKNNLSQKTEANAVRTGMCKFIGYLKLQLNAVVCEILPVKRHGWDLVGLTVQE